MYDSASLKVLYFVVLAITLLFVFLFSIYYLKKDMYSSLIVDRDKFMKMVNNGNDLCDCDLESFICCDYIEELDFFIDKD